MEQSSQDTLWVAKVLKRVKADRENSDQPALGACNFVGKILCPGSFFISTVRFKVNEYTFKGGNSVKMILSPFSNGYTLNVKEVAPLRSKLLLF